MPPSTPTSIRLTAAERKRIAQLARRKGLSPAAYIKQAALAGPPASDITRLARLEKATAVILAAVEDELDARVGDLRWEEHLKNKTRLHTSAEVKRELGL